MSRSLWLISHSSQLVAISKPDEGALHPLAQVINKVAINRIGPSCDSWGYTACYWLKFALLAATLWAKPFNQGLKHFTVHPSSPYINSFSRRIFRGIA